MATSSSGRAANGRKPRQFLIQFQNVKSKDVSEFTGTDHLVVVGPPDMKTGELITPVCKGAPVSAIAAAGRSCCGGPQSKTSPMLSFDLLANAIVSGLLLGGFYAGVTAGATISFGLLDIANIAHPAFVVFGAYGAFLLSERFGLDPLLAALIVVPVFYVAGAAVYQVYHRAFERRGDDSMRGLAFFFGLMFVGEVVLILTFGVDYRYTSAAYASTTLKLGPVALPLRELIPFIGALAILSRGAAFSETHLHWAAQFWASPRTRRLCASWAPTRCA